MAILVDGQPTSYFTPKQGIQQGCPLSPFLFTVAINELSISLKNAMHAANLIGITLGPNCPPIHSLLFADDLSLCGAATTLEANSINQILNDFCHHSGQIPSFSKSYIHFSHNVDNATKNNIRNIFLVPNLPPNTMHLGHPIIFNHKDKNHAYHFIYNKFLAKLTIVKANKLNHAGHLTYIQFMLSSIPVYYMSTVLFSNTFIQKINFVLRCFWWAGVQDDDPTNPIAHRSWDDICQSKENGGG